MSRPRRHAARPALEELEPKVTPTVFVVDSTDDTIAADGKLTLREAIQAADTDAPAGDAPAGSAGLDQIQFAIGTGVVTINLTSALPAVTEAVSIDGTTQPGFAGKPVVVLDGGALTSGDGLDLTSHTGSKVRGLVVSNFPGVGVQVTGGGGHVLAGNYIGTDPTGTAGAPNKNGGVVITGGSAGNVIGGSTAADGNLISGNGSIVAVTGRLPFTIYTGPGVLLTGAGTDNNRVVGNLIGTDATGTRELHNGKSGVLIADGASGNVIGGPTAGERNVISGNGQANVQILNLTPGSGPIANTQVLGNYIGTDVTGMAAVPRPAQSAFYDGITVESATGTRIGAPGAGNVISGVSYGVHAGSNGEATGTVIQGNRIGTNAAGDALIPNDSDGVRVDFGDVLVGGTAPGAGNLISGNAVGVNTTGIATRTGRVQGNLIGTDATGNRTLGNRSTGVSVAAGVVGGADPGAGNVIAGNGKYGVTPGSGVVVQGNLIGIGKDGTTPLGNTLDGVFAATKAVIGGINPGEGNRIAHNGGAGVLVYPQFGNDVTFLVGNSVLGNDIFDNAGLGIELYPAGVNPIRPPGTGGAANNAQNYPVLGSATAGPSGTTVTGTLGGLSSTTYRIEFFGVATPDPSGFGEGDVFLGAINVSVGADPSGAATVTFTATLPALPAGVGWVSATATNVSTGDTSEFSQTIRTSPPVAPPPATRLPSVTAVGADAGGGPFVQLVGPDGTVQRTFAPFDASFTGGVRTATADFNGDGVADVVAGTGPGVEARVRVLDGKDGHELFSLTPFPGFTGGVFVAAGDLTGDGTPDLVITPDLSGGPRVRVFRGGDFGQVADFLGINDPAFRGGARAALGDVDGDGKADLAVAAGFGGGPRVAIFSGAKVAAQGTQAGLTADVVEAWKLVGDFIAFDPALRNGVYVAAGDVDGDGRADLILGAGPGGGPEVRIVNGKSFLGLGGPSLTTSAADPTRLADFFAGDTANRGGIRVAARDIDGDGRADLIVGPGDAGGAHVTAYPAKTLTFGGGPTAWDLDAFPGFTNGVFVG